MKREPTFESDNNSLTIDTLTTRVSPPPIKGVSYQDISENDASDVASKIDLAAIEAGEAKIKDHLEHFSSRLSKSIRYDNPPRISLKHYISLYRRNQNPSGHHFVVHQHDHPVAGTHYDLRLQINETSSASWAIMYGLPGNPASRRLNRNATETRIHCLWNHLIETASHATGSLLIWDTGEYEVLPYKKPDESETTDRDSSGEDSDPVAPANQLSQPEKLHNAFQHRKIRLRLHGSRLPKGYTMTLRMSSVSKSQLSQPKRPSRKRRKKDPRHAKSVPLTDEDSGEETKATSPDGAHSDNDEDEAVRLANAYPGANNTIGSVHQRIWYATLDRDSSGFKKQRDPSGNIVWVRKDTSPDAPGFDAFIVRGRDYERSVLTGRLAKDVLEDEGVKSYVGRAGWKGVLQ